MNDFAKWLQDNEVKNVNELAGRPGEDDEDFRPAIQNQRTGQWSAAKWDRKNPGNHECFSCRGSGLWSPPVYATRGKTGKCHKCQGRGHFKTSAAERAKAREYRRLTTAQKLSDTKLEFEAEHPGLIAFLANAGKWSDFAQSLFEQYGQRGSLSPKQIAAAKSMKAKCEAREAEKKEKQQEAAADPTGLDLTELPSGYYGVPMGETRLKVRINRPGKDSRWHGYIFVSDGAAYGHGNNYGRQAPGKQYEGKIVDQLRRIMQDPAEASKEYARLTGRCGVCNTLLENEESIARGIGPVCAAKYGWD